MADSGNISEQVLTLTDILAPVAEPLEQVREQLKSELGSEIPYLQDLTVHAHQFGGKHLRPAVLLFSASVCGTIQPMHIELGVVLELLHNATLVHDDILDEASMRRKTQTINDRWGNEPAVIFGDWIFAKAFLKCASLKEHIANIELARTTQILCEGELTQISNRNNFAMSEDTYFEIIEKKTASLFEAAARLGACGNGPVDDEITEGLCRFGRAFGTAFQIIDDCLDLTGQENEMGKSLGTDLDKSKPTLPLIYLLSAVTDDERTAIVSLLESDRPAADKKKDLADYVERYAVVDYAMERALRFAEDARLHLAVVPEGPIRDRLHELTEFSLQRRF
jgi:octaprenyl-diphosphate synthase